MAEQEEIVIARRRTDDTPDATNPSEETIEAARRYRYPLTISENYPARIIFTAREIESVNIEKKLLDFVTDVTTSTSELLKGESVTSSVADKRVPSDTAQQIEESERQSERNTESFENIQRGKNVGSVTLPLQRDLRFSDNAQYETANLGVIGGALEQSLQGQNPFAGATQNGQLRSTSGALVAQAVASASGALVGGLAGKFLAGNAGAVLGVAGLGGDFGLSSAVRNTTRITSAPNQRTLFQQVNIRSFAFTFKMIANNEKEASEIKNIVKFFRQELYPEMITIGESGVPLAYRFPNVFDIQIKNQYGDNPAFSIQQCFLRDVQTSFNGTATGMHSDGNFIEVDISLAFQETVALDKAKVRRGY